MDRMQAELEPLLEVIRYHIPPVWLDNALAGAVAVGVVGLVLALWGGRVFRPALVLVFAAGGVWVGLAGNQWLGLGQWPTSWLWWYRAASNAVRSSSCAA